MWKNICSWFKSLFVKTAEHHTENFAASVGGQYQDNGIVITGLSTEDSSAVTTKANEAAITTAKYAGMSKEGLKDLLDIEKDYSRFWADMAIELAGQLQAARAEVCDLKGTSLCPATAKKAKTRKSKR